MYLYFALDTSNLYYHHLGFCQVSISEFNRAFLLFIWRLRFDIPPAK